MGRERYSPAVEEAAWEFSIDPEVLTRLVQRWGEDILEGLRELSEEERDDDFVLHIISEKGLERYLESKNYVPEKVDYTGIEVENSVDSSYCGDDSWSNDDITPMDEYDENNAVNRGNVFFIPALSNKLTQPFLDRNSSLTVISFGIIDYDCTVYLLAPSPVVRWYHNAADTQSTREADDPFFDEHIEGLKLWAPENTRFMNRRIISKPGWPWFINQTRGLVTHMFRNDYEVPEDRDFNPFVVDSSAVNQVEKFLRKFTEWWGDAELACRRAGHGHSVGQPKIPPKERDIIPCPAGCDGGRWDCECDGSGRVRCETCGGSGGEYWMSQWLECRSCHGSRRSTCQTCYGNGRKRCDTCQGSGEAEWSG